MKSYFLVVVDTTDDKADALQSEIFSNLQSVDTELGIQDIRVTSIPELAADLKTLFVSTQDATEPIECAAALGNFTHDLLHLVLEDPHSYEFDEDGETNLDKFNLLRT